MSIKSAVDDKVVEVQSRKGCKFAHLLNSMTDEDFEATKYALGLCQTQSDDYSANWLTKVLNDNDFAIGKTSVNDHIAGRCSCERS